MGINATSQRMTNHSSRCVFIVCIWRRTKNTLWSCIVHQTGVKEKKRKKKSKVLPCGLMQYAIHEQSHISVVSVQRNIWYPYMVVNSGQQTVFYKDNKGFISNLWPILVYLTRLYVLWFEPIGIVFIYLFIFFCFLNHLVYR